MTSELALLLLLLLVPRAISKPITAPLNQNVNEIDTGKQGDYKSLVSDSDKIELREIPRPITRLSIAKTTSSKNSISSTVQLPKTTEAEITHASRLTNLQNSTSDNTSTLPRQQGLAWMLTPFTQKIQFSPQQFFQDKIGQFKDTLSHLGSFIPNQQPDVDSKQFANVGPVQNLVGLNDSGFYTDRLDPAGFFGGNGWFANKGGILGGPGAFISTGSLFTDYPTAYKK